jgi:CRP-like cAMP-binding protein
MLQQEGETRKSLFMDRMPQEKCEALERMGEYRAYPAGTVVHTQGDSFHGVLVLQSGLMKLTRSVVKDKVQVIELARPGQIMGEVQLLTGLPAVATATAAEDSECWHIPADAVMPMLESDPVVASVFLWHLAEKVRHMVPLIEDLGLHTVPERVAKLILYFHANEPEKPFVEFRETQEGLSHYIGSSREALNRALKMLCDLGFVHNSFPVVHIVDEAGLRRFASGRGV